MPNIVNAGYDSANYHLIESPAARLLVDVGWPGTLPKLYAALKRMGMPGAGGHGQPGKAVPPPGGIGYLLATHYHPDNAGAAEELKRQGVQLIVLENQAAGIQSLNEWMRARPQYRYVDITLEGNVCLHSSESRGLLRGLGLEGEIIPTPGHSDDSVTLILDSGVAFTGDLPPPGAFGEVEHPAERSWELLRARHVHTVYPGHGPARQLG